MGRKRKGRPVNGVILIDKHQGESSNHIVQQVKRLYKAQKAGHTGALDPLATGMLPVCLGEATKFSQFLLEANKTYEVTAKLGVRTDTSDADGEVVEEHPVKVSLSQIEKALANFRGEIEQTPSIFSALKYEGKPLYYYARKGIDVPRPTRTIHVFSNDVISLIDDELSLRIHCSKGTYIRTIVDDLGQLLGCSAHVKALRRISIEQFESLPMITTESLSESAVVNAGDEEDFRWLDKQLLPMDIQVQSLPIVNIRTSEAEQFKHGMQIAGDKCLVFGDNVRVYNIDAHGEEQFLGIANVIENNMLQPKRLVVVHESIAS